MKIRIGLLAFAVLLMFTGMEVQADIYTNDTIFSVPNTSGWDNNQKKTSNADGSTTWEFTSNDRHGNPGDFMDLPHSGYYFSWFNQSPDLAGLQIQSATIWFDNISNSNRSTHDLWVNLLDEVPEGDESGDVDYYYDDNTVTGHANDFDTTLEGVTELVQYDEDDFNATPVAPVDISYTFTGAQLDTLEDYLKNSTFGIGLDPDTKYQNDGVYLVINTGPPTDDGTSGGTSHTPEPGSIFLLGAGMITLAGWKRRRWSDKIKP